jgi:hypothetical protein
MAKLDVNDFKDLVGNIKKIRIEETGKEVSVFPIPISKFAIAVSHLAKLADYIGENATQNKSLLEAVDDILPLVPLSTDITDLDTIPSTVLPEILAAIIDLNVTPTVIKNWQTLIQKMTGIVKVQKSEDQGGGTQ